jgi:hypothetical protein
MAIITGITAAVAVLLVYASPSIANHTCTGANINNISPDDPRGDLDDIVNADPETTATTFCVHSGNYTIDRIVRLHTGDQIQGEPGTRTSVGPATQPVPSVKVSPGANNVPKLIEPIGSNIRVTWLDLSGATGQYDLNGKALAGTGVAIGVGNADGTFIARYLSVHNNDAVGISNMRGRVMDSEFFSNTEDKNFAGFTGSAVKGITEFVAARNFVHDEQANGIWLDLGRNDPLRGNGYWVHHNLVVRATRAGIRYENSPPRLAPGVHQKELTALIENNAVYGNSLTQPDAPRPISVQNSQNAMIRANTFGTATINGVTYPHNGFNVAVRAADVGKTEKTDMWNVDIIGNDLNGEKIVVSTRIGQTLACGQVPAAMVYCANNSP